MTNINGRKSVLQLLGGSSIGRGINFGINLLLSRILGPAELGLFALILSTSQTFELLSRAGVDYGLTCALTEKPKEQNIHADQSLIHTALKIVRATSFFFLVLLLLWLGPAGGLLPEGIPESRNLLIILSSFICVSESLSGLPWDILLVKGRINIVRLKQSLFAPLKLFSALIGAWIGGIISSLTFYAITASLQAIWLNKKTGGKSAVGETKQTQWNQAKNLIRDGWALYINNALSAFIFLPLVAEMAATSGLSSVGYLRVGQLVVQLFTLIPGALTPILFIKSRTTKSEPERIRITELSMITIWIIGLTTMLVYRIFDSQIITVFFGEKFITSIQPTRVLIYITIIESIGQILHSPLLAQKKIKLFLVAQNLSLLLAGIVGAYLIPSMGLQGYLLAKLLFGLVPAIIYMAETWSRLQNKLAIIILGISSVFTFILCWFQSGQLLVNILILSVSFAGVALSGFIVKRQGLIY